MTRVLSRLALAGLALCLSAACVPIPYKPSATVASGSNVEMPPTLVVRSQEDDVVRSMARKIHAKDDKLEVVHHRELQDFALADGDCALAALIDPEQRDRLRRYLGLSFLVVVGDLAESDATKHGGFIPLLGAGTFSSTTSASASIIDLADGQPVTGIDSRTSASGGGVIYGFFGVFIVPMSESSVYDGITNGVVSAIREKSGEGPLRIAVVHVSVPETAGCADAAECNPVQPVPDLAGADAPVPSAAPDPGNPTVQQDSDRIEPQLP